MHPPNKKMPRMAGQGQTRQMGEHLGQSVTDSKFATLEQQGNPCEFRPRLADLACTCRLTGTCWTCRQWSNLLGKMAARAILAAGFANYRGASVGAAQ